MPKRSRSKYPTITADDTIESLLGDDDDDDESPRLTTITSRTRDADARHSLQLGLPVQPAYISFLSQYEAHRALEAFFTRRPPPLPNNVSTNSSWTTILYLYGATGCGKTSLVSYVLAKHYIFSSGTPILPLIYCPQSKDELSMLAVQRYTGTCPVTVILDDVASCSAFVPSSVLGLVGSVRLSNHVPVQWLLVGDQPSDIAYGVRSKTSIDRRQCVQYVHCPLPEMKRLRDEFPHIPEDILQTQNMHVITRRPTTDLVHHGTHISSEYLHDSYAKRIYRELYDRDTVQKQLQRPSAEFLSRQWLQALYWVWVPPNVSFRSTHTMASSMDALSFLDADILPSRRNTGVFSQTDLLDNMQWVAQQSALYFRRDTICQSPDHVQMVSRYPSKRYGSLVG